MYKVEVRVKGETTFAGNGLRFQTEDEATNYAKDLAGRWTAVEEYRVVEVTDAAN